MINPEFGLASWFLLLASAGFALVIAIPLLFAPLRWARMFGWQLPSGSLDLTVYFGRCLGGVALALILTVAQAAPAPQRHPEYFELIAATSGLMVAIHIWGWLRREQPISETLETFVWALMMVLSIGIRQSLPTLELSR